MPAYVRNDFRLNSADEVLILNVKYIPCLSNSWILVKISLTNDPLYLFSVTESELSGSPGIKNETIITSTTSNNKDEVLVTAESTSTSNLDTILLEFVENEADNLTTSKLDAILSEFVKENGVSEKEIAEFFLVVEEAKVQNELKSTTTKRKVLTS